jgi:hypothetical protein
MSTTVNDLVQQVDSLLTGPEGRERCARFNGLASQMVASLPMLRTLRASVTRRASMQLYVNLSNAKEAGRRGVVTLSARVHGVECGMVTIGTDGDRAFAPTNPHVFGQCDADSTKGCQWRDPRVGQYIRAAAGLDFRWHREAAIESALILRMKGRGEAWRQTQQPVCLAGLPFRVPLPVAASGATPTLGDGHIDVLARLDRGAKGLRVYELKAPNVPVRTAMTQAVIYVATLRHMLSQDEGSEAWWRLIGFRKAPVRRRCFEAFAVVEDTQPNRSTVDDAIRELERANNSDAHITLDALYYTHDPHGGLKIRRR